MELTFFRFEPAKYLSGDIQMCSLETQGAFVNVMSLYWQRQCDLSVAHLRARFTPEVFDGLMNVLKIEGDNVVIEFLDEQFEMLSTRKEKQINAGRVAGLASIVKRSGKKRDAKQPPEKKQQDIPTVHPELSVALRHLKDSRSKARKPMTDHAIDLMVAKLNRLAPNDIPKQIAMIEQSIEHGWSGVFELKEQKRIPNGSVKVIPKDKIFDIPKS